VEAQRPHAGALERPVVTAPQRRGVEVRPGIAEEDEVVVSGRMAALPEPGQSFRHVGCERHRPHARGLRRG
jgi:hypothetical protein